MLNQKCPKNQKSSKFNRSKIESSSNYRLNMANWNEVKRTKSFHSNRLWCKGIKVSASTCRNVAISTVAVSQKVKTFFFSLVSLTISISFHSTQPHNGGRNFSPSGPHLYCYCLSCCDIHQIFVKNASICLQSLATLWAFLLESDTRQS